MAGSISKYPCPYCIVTSEQADESTWLDRTESQNEGKRKSQRRHVPIELGSAKRTFEGLRRHALGRDYDNRPAQEHWGAVRQPFTILEGHDLLQMFPVDSLHLLINYGINLMILRLIIVKNIQVTS